MGSGTEAAIRALPDFFHRARFASRAEESVVDAGGWSLFRGSRRIPALSLTPLAPAPYIALEGIPHLPRLCVVRHKLQLVALQWIPPASPDRVRFMARGNFGERLKRERELREVSPNEIVVATRISQRFLEALENEQWEKLPGGVFNRGFVRAIARYLGLDEENLLAEYDLARGDQVPEASLAENRIPSPSKWILALIAFGLLIVLAALALAAIYGSKWYSARRRVRTSAAITQANPGSPPGSAAIAPANTTATPKLSLSVSASSTTHLRILADGKPTFDSQINAGDTWHFSADSAFEVTAANSGAVLLELNGQAMPTIGPSGASGTIVLSEKDLRPAAGGNPKP